MLLSPVVNSYIQGKTFCVEAELPGLDKKDIDVSIDGNALTIRGERRVSEATKREDFLLKESRYGAFFRSIVLPEGVDTENVHAGYDNGILKITMPVEKKPAGGKRVKIEGPAAGREEKREQSTH